jgi:hypothetical protein
MEIKLICFGYCEVFVRVIKISIWCRLTFITVYLTFQRLITYWIVFAATKRTVIIKVFECIGIFHIRCLHLMILGKSVVFLVVQIPSFKQLTKREWIFYLTGFSLKDNIQLKFTLKKLYLNKKCIYMRNIYYCIFGKGRLTF